jgi:D-alanyl-lipoteichoic acid acyltransferase DltB (MBOAT superfamily)
MLMCWFFSGAVCTVLNVLCSWFSFYASGGVWGGVGVEYVLTKLCLSNLRLFISDHCKVCKT